MAASESAKPFLVRLRPADIIALDALAAAAGVSRNRFVIDLITAEIVRHEKPQRPRRPVQTQQLMADAATDGQRLTAADFE